MLHMHTNNILTHVRTWFLKPFTHPKEYVITVRLFRHAALQIVSKMHPLPGLVPSFSCYVLKAYTLLLSFCLEGLVWPGSLLFNGTCATFGPVNTATYVPLPPFWFCDERSVCHGWRISYESRSKKVFNQCRRLLYIGVCENVRPGAPPHPPRRPPNCALMEYFDISKQLAEECGKVFPEARAINHQMILWAL